MKRHWTKHRQFVPHPDGEQRWDRAYQYLLLWAKETKPILSTNSGSSSGENQEVDHASSSLRQSFDQKSG
jgi:hypothetical protein